MTWAEELGLTDPANWPIATLFTWSTTSGFSRDPRRRLAGVGFGVIVLKVATRLDFPLSDRWMMMGFAYLGTVFLIDSIRAKDPGA